MYVSMVVQLKCEYVWSRHALSETKILVQTTDGVYIEHLNIPDPTKTRLKIADATMCQVSVTQDYIIIPSDHSLTLLNPFTNTSVFIPIPHLGVKLVTVNATHFITVHPTGMSLCNLTSCYLLNTTLNITLPNPTDSTSMESNNDSNSDSLDTMFNITIHNRTITIIIDSYINLLENMPAYEDITIDPVIQHVVATSTNVYFVWDEYLYVWNFDTTNITSRVYVGFPVDNLIVEESFGDIFVIADVNDTITALYINPDYEFDYSSSRIKLVVPYENDSDDVKIAYSHGIICVTRLMTDYISVWSLHNSEHRSFYLLDVDMLFMVASRYVGAIVKNQVRIFHAYDGHVVYEFSGHTEITAYLVDDEFIYLGFDDGTIRMNKLNIGMAEKVMQMFMQTFAMTLDLE